MPHVVDEVKGLYKVIAFKEIRKTPGVTFDVIPVKALGQIDAVDRVLHESDAISPCEMDGIARPWYMHTHQQDNLIVLDGIRYVDIYTPAHGKIEQFTVTPDCVYKGDKLIVEGGAMLVWPRGVFHRIVSGDGGSASINLAVHYDGFDIKTNFNIYDINMETGRFHVVRQGALDQP
jgi:hypothetical protein